jgi:glycine cleavage system H lipoate-binding protein
MEALGASDIFATKGVEYLMVIAYLALLVGLWRLLRAPRATGATAGGTGRIGVASRGPFQVPDDRYFHQGHTWAAPREGETVRVGMDDFARKLLGAPVSFELPPVGAHVRQGDHAWTVQLDGERFDMLSPVDGEVVGVNQDAIASPATVAEDPYDRWLLEVRVPKLRANLTNLLSGFLARAWMEQTAERVRAVQSAELGVLVPDGGVPVEGFARHLDPERWQEIAREFLLTGNAPAVGA